MAQTFEEMLKAVELKNFQLVAKHMKITVNHVEGLDVLLNTVLDLWSEQNNGKLSRRSIDTIKWAVKQRIITSSEHSKLLDYLRACLAVYPQI